MQPPILAARGLKERYGRTQALAGLDLVLNPGRVVALLGPDGAGKTTLVRAVAALLRPDAGTLHADGIGAPREPARAGQVIGLAGQSAAAEEAMTGRENLEMAGRLQLWDTIRGLAAAGTDILLTTRYLDGAGRLASGIVIIDHGTVIAAGTPAELKTRAGDDMIEVHVRDAGHLPAVSAALATTGRDRRVDAPQHRACVAAGKGSSPLTDTLRVLDAHGITVEDISLRRPTLDEVFLSLTGTPAQTAGTPGQPVIRPAGRRHHHDWHVCDRAIPGYAPGRAQHGGRAVAQLGRRGRADGAQVRPHPAAHRLHHDPGRAVPSRTGPDRRTRNAAARTHFAEITSMTAQGQARAPPVREVIAES